MVTVVGKLVRRAKTAVAAAAVVVVSTVARDNNTDSRESC